MASSCRDRATSMAEISSPRRTSSADRDSRSPTPTRRAAHARSVSEELSADSRSPTPRSAVVAAATSRINSDAGVEGDDEGDRVPGGSRYDAEDPAADADVEAIQAHLCRRFAAAPSDDHPTTGSVRTGYQPPFAAAGIFATIRRLVVSSSSCSHGRSQATAL